MIATFLRNKAATWSLGFMLIVTVMAVFAPLFSTHEYAAQDFFARLQGPTLAHWMGTDTLGRDLYSRILYGARMSLAIGVFTAIFALVLGTLTGAIAGYWGGRVDTWIMRLVDFFYIFPSLLVAILLTLVLGQGFLGVFAAIGFSAWVTQARLVRGLVLQIRELPYVEAARATGAAHSRILFRHILPNLWGPVIVSLTFQIPTNIMTESFLSFIGLGLKPPYASWGTLANEGFRAMQSFPHLILFPGVILFLAMITLNYVGDGLRDALDPKSTRMNRE